MKKLIFSFFFLLLFVISNSQNLSQNKTYSAEAKLAAKEQTQKLRDRVVKGEKMEDIARQYSEDPGSAMKGGLYMNVGKGVMDAEFEKVAFSLKQGQVSQVFETVYGYHFVQMIKKHGELVDIRHVLVIPKEQK
ncbi:MAG: peptidylprolyl isomerase [Bacteroidota bacterium]|nr:peptidylprolyl isomerase [Bacteroidota bacterium]